MIRHIEGLVYDYSGNPGWGGALIEPCALCGAATKMAAWVRPKSRQRKRPPAVPICGLCWEDQPAHKIWNASYEAAFAALDKEKNKPVDSPPEEGTP